MEEQKKKTSPKFDSAKSSKTGDALATLITGTVAKARPQSIAEGLLMKNGNCLLQAAMQSAST